MTRHELAWTIANQGRGEEAEHLLSGVLAARERVLGSDHLRTLWTRHELAWAIAIQRRWAEAEAMFRDVLDARAHVLRADHPDILTSKQELAWTVAAQGRHSEALELYESVLDARRATLGAGDPDTERRHPWRSMRYGAARSSSRGTGPDWQASEPRVQVGNAPGEQLA
jgi:tetratricopeptide (TPR) repeat protein